MDKGKKTLLLTLALIFIGMLLLSSVFATRNLGEGSSQTNSPVQVSYKIDQTAHQFVQPPKQYDYHPNYYNDNTYLANSQIRPVRVYYLNKHEDKTRNYWHKGGDYNDKHYYYDKAPINIPSYTQRKTETTRDNLFGDYVKEYSVYVTNNGRTGRYYTVAFNLEDKNGYEFTQSVTQYLKTGENKKFVYRDIQYERNEILSWDYDIIPENY